MDSDDCFELIEENHKIKDEKSLIEAAWNDETGEATKILANYIRTSKKQTKDLPETILNQIWNDDSFQLGKNINNDTILEQFIALLSTDAQINDNLVTEFLIKLENSSTNLHPEKLQTFYSSLWHRLSLLEASPSLTKSLIRLNISHIHQKLDKIARESDQEGWNLIKFIDGYSQILEIAVKDKSGHFFQAILKYFVTKILSKDFLGTVMQEMATIFVNDVKYRVEEQNFVLLFPENLQFYLKLLNLPETKVIEEILEQLLKNSKEEYLMIIIGFNEYLDLNFLQKIHQN